MSEGYDFTTPEGELMAYQLIAFAQFERKRGGQRRAEGTEIIKETGRWNGGRVPYGYAPSGHKGNWRLVQDPDTVSITRRMVTGILAGKGLLTIAKELNAEGIKPSTASYWRSNTIRQILRSPALMGYQTHMAGPNRDSVTLWRNSQGQPVKFTDDPIVTEDEWRKIQDVVKARSRARIAPQARHLLASVLYCRNCSEPCDDESPCPVHDMKLHGHRRVKHVEKGNYYRCPRCRFSVRISTAEHTIEQPIPETITRQMHGSSVTQGVREELDDDPEDKDLRRPD